MRRRRWLLTRFVRLFPTSSIADAATKHLSRKRIRGGSVDRKIRPGPSCAVRPGQRNSTIWSGHQPQDRSPPKSRQNGSWNATASFPIPKEEVKYQAAAVRTRGTNATQSMLCFFNLPWIDSLSNWLYRPLPKSWIRLSRSGPSSNAPGQCPVHQLHASHAQSAAQIRQAAAIFSPHSFSVLVVTSLLSQDVPVEDVQHLASQANLRITQIFDRPGHRVARNIVARISV